MRIGLIALAMLVFAMGAKAHTPAVDPFEGVDADPAFDRATFEKFKTVTVSVNWHQVDVAACLEQIRKKMARAKSEDSAIHFVVQIPPETDRITYRRPVSIVLTDVPVLDLLAYMENQTNLTALFHKNEVVLVPVAAARAIISGVKPR